MGAQRRDWPGGGALCAATGLLGIGGGLAGGAARHTFVGLAVWLRTRRGGCRRHRPAAAAAAHRRRSPRLPRCQRCHTGLPAAALALPGRLPGGDRAALLPSPLWRCSLQDVECTRRLLELGANPNANSIAGQRWPALAALLFHQQGSQLPPAGLQVAQMLLQRGAHCLGLPETPSLGALSKVDPSYADLCLAHMEQQHRAGCLPPDSLSDAWREELLVAAVNRGHLHLVAGFCRDFPSRPVLEAAIRSGSLPVLRLLLPSYPPLALSWGPAAKLAQSSVLGFAAAVEVAVHGLAAEGVAALLACGLPDVPVDQPSTTLNAGRRPNYSCPIHRLLLLQVGVQHASPCRGSGRGRASGSGSGSGFLWRLCWLVQAPAAALHDLRPMWLFRVP